MRSRRSFLKMTTLSGMSLVLGVPSFDAAANVFRPRRAASWWSTLDDLGWPEKKVVDRIQRRAAAFAEAGIDTAINFGFHIRFDFSNYFGQLHGYLANVCEELHKYDIRFLDHYSCNHVERPRGMEGLRYLEKSQRHHVLLFHDAKSAATAQYEGHFFNDLCEIDLRDGSRGFSSEYQLEIFCHNNPGFLDMHRKYLQRLLSEVPMDGIQVDDMCDYGGLTTCGCKYCRDRFQRDYGHVVPAYGAGYDDPVFRDWLRMRADSVADHLKMIKETVGEKPLMTCCSNAGPMVLNTVALNLEKMAPYLDWFMLENVGIYSDMVHWAEMDAEAMFQKDVARKKGNAPAITVSYLINEKGGYLGWALGRFWGVANWSSTLYGRLEEDPANAKGVEEIIGPYNVWEKKYSDIDPDGGLEFAELRLVSSSACRENGWRDAEGREQWDRVQDWSKQLVENNIGYRLVRGEELGDVNALLKGQGPVVMDGVACVSDRQWNVIREYISKGGVVWIEGPFGTHDEKGFKREKPLSVKTRQGGLRALLASGKLKPMLRQVGGDKGWAVRLRRHGGKLYMHFLNFGGFGGKLVYAYYGNGVLRSPELGGETRAVADEGGQLTVDLTGIQTYAVVEISK